MSTDIPLKIRVGIRDQWESPKAPIHHSIDALSKILGQVITPQVEWSKLYYALKDTFSEPNFVPAIYRITIAFYGRLLSMLEKESDKEWKGKFLAGMSKITNWKLQLEVSMDAEDTPQRPKLIWRADAGSFCIHIPKCKPAGNAILEAGFDEDLKNLFGGSTPVPKAELETSTPSTTPTAVASTASSPLRAKKQKPVPELPKEEDKDGELQQIDKPKKPSPSTKPTLPALAHERHNIAAQAPEKPSTADLAVTRPSRLFRHITPYVLVVDAEKVPLRIQCSHQATLEHISSYLRRWARLDQGSLLHQPLLKVEMVESAFFSGIQDSITIEPTYSRGEQQPLNPTMILGMIEGVLGYKEVFTNGTRWTFKRYPEGVSKTSLHDRDQRLHTS